jgi:hypothetical protein
MNYSATSHPSARTWPLLALAALPFVLACDSPTEPKKMAINTVEVTVKGGLNFNNVVDARGSFLHVTGGDDRGVRIQTDVQGFPLVIHIPGEPTTGKFRLGEWDPARDGARVDTIPHVRTFPNPSFGEHPAAAFAHYTSLEGGTLEIDAVQLPAFPDHDKGSIRGRLNTRAVANSLMLPPGTSIPKDTIEISVEFLVELGSLSLGRASVQFVGGSLAGEETASMIGNGVIYRFDDRRDEPLLLISLTAPPTKSGERLQLWFGTKLLETGQAEIVTIAPGDIHEHWRWPDHFAAGRSGDRSIASLNGIVRLDAYEKLTTNRRGEAKGKVTVDLVVQDPAGEGEPERTTAVITFHMPVIGTFEVF